jgi:endonuclease/exonuclease/phosphatase family metal-dependent hydrolase
MKYKFILIFSVLIILLHQSYAQVNPVKFNIVSLNTMLLPSAISLSHQTTRTKQIIEILKDYPTDVVVLQEVFINNHRKKIQKLLENIFPYQYHLEKSKTDKLSFLSSGLVVLSKKPFTLLEAIHYKNYNKLSFDRFSSKGVIFIEFKNKNKPSLQLAITHLQAGSSKRNAKIRLKQLAEIQQMQLRHRRHNTLQAVVGDININGYDEISMENAKMVLPFTTTSLSGPLQYTHGHKTQCFNPTDFLSKSKQTWLDHFWLTYGTKESLKIPTNQYVVPFIGNIRFRTCPLSDHFGIHVNLTI